MSIEKDILSKLSYCPSCGVVTWKAGPRVGQEAGYISPTQTPGLSYRKINISGKNLRTHRIAWLLFYGEWPKHHIDHIDHDGLNNRISNLRDVTPKENQGNLHPERKKNRFDVSSYRKKKGPHVKNRMKVRTFAFEYQSKHGKWPTYKLIKSSCRVGETVISEVMKELKRSKAA